VLLGVALVLAFQGCSHVLRRGASFGGRAKEAEARVNLKALCILERRFQEERHAYEADLAKVGFSPERSNRYVYFAAPTGGVQRRESAELATSTPASYSIVAADRFRFGDLSAPTALELTGCPVTIAFGPAGERYGLGVSADGRVWLGLAAGNVDPDPILDCWSVATVARIAHGGELVPACEPLHEQLDIEE
jgi:type IV pilus assembly protein PilA